MDWMYLIGATLLTFAATRAWLLRKPRPRAKTMAEIRAEWLTQRHHWQGGN